MIGIFSWGMTPGLPLVSPSLSGQGYPAGPGRKPSGVAAAKRAKKKRRAAK